MELMREGEWRERCAIAVVLVDDGVGRSGCIGVVLILVLRAVMV